MNSGGGTLLIGVEDDGNVCGLTQDLKTTGDSRDKYEQLLANLIAARIGAHIAHLVPIRFEALDGAQVCVVEVDRGLSPAYLQDTGGAAFYVRLGATWRQLDVEEATGYIQTNWE